MYNYYKSMFSAMYGCTKYCIYYKLINKVVINSFIKIEFYEKINKT